MPEPRFDLQERMRRCGLTSRTVGDAIDLSSGQVRSLLGGFGYLTPETERRICCVIRFEETYQRLTTLVEELTP